jgi:hypothetical protein
MLTRLILPFLVTVDMTAYGATELTFSQGGTNLIAHSSHWVTPLNARRIAFVPRLFWVDPHQWNKYPSQQSGTIQLKAGETYFIEAIQEQTSAGEHLSVRWQEPGPERSAISVINGRYLTPWRDIRGSAETATNGILREYWTNYPAATVENMIGDLPFESALTVEQVFSHIHGPGSLPKPERVRLGKPMPAESNRVQALVWPWTSHFKFQIDLLM